eukprot:scaffold335549_cov19-Prasinocladus_malaysianus.AAC.1
MDPTGYPNNATYIQTDREAEVVPEGWQEEEDSRNAKERERRYGTRAMKEHETTLPIRSAYGSSTRMDDKVCKL